MAIRNAGKCQNPKVIAFNPLAICILVEKIKQITKGSLSSVRSPKLITSKSRTTHSRNRSLQYNPALGGIKIKVREEDSKKALKILNEESTGG